MSKMWDIKIYYKRTKNDCWVFDQSNLVNDFAILKTVHIRSTVNMGGSGTHGFSFGHFEYESLLGSQVELLWCRMHWMGKSGIQGTGRGWRSTCGSF